MALSRRTHTRSLRALAAIVAASQCPFEEIASAADCIKYVYADTSHSTEGKVPVFACGDVVNSTATNCRQVGSIDMKKIEELEKSAKQKMWAYGRGIIAGMACTMTIDFGPYLLPTAAKALIGGGKMIGNSVTASVAVENAYKNDTAGTRTPGDLASKERGELYQSIATKGCKYFKKTVLPNSSPREITASDSFNLGMDSAISLFAFSSSHAAVLKGDAKYIWSLPTGAQRQEAFQKFQARVAEVQDQQTRIMDASVKVGLKVYKFMTDNSLRTIPFGTSPVGVSDKLKCINPSDVTKFHATLCKVAKTTAELGNYLPGDLFKNEGAKATDRVRDQVVRAQAAVEENCQNDEARVSAELTKLAPSGSTDSGSSQGGSPSSTITGGN